MIDSSLFTPLMAYLGVLLILTILSVTVPSRVVSVVFLIGSYLIGVGIALLFGFEFIAMAIMIVYMGAIAVFFLFIVMVLGGIAPARPLTPYAILGGFGILVGSFVIAVIFSLPAQFVAVTGGVVSPSAIASIPFTTTSLASLGFVLYTTNASLFIGSGLLLLVAIVVVIAVVSLRGHSPRVSQEAIDQRLRLYTRL